MLFSSEFAFLTVTCGLRASQLRKPNPIVWQNRDFHWLAHVGMLRSGTWVYGTQQSKNEKNGFHWGIDGGEALREDDRRRENRRRQTCCPTTLGKGEKG